MAVEFILLSGQVPLTSKYHFMNRGALKCPHLDLFLVILFRNYRLSWFCCQEVVDYIISDILPDLTAIAASLVLTGNIGAVIFMFSLQLL